MPKNLGDLDGFQNVLDALYTFRFSGYIPFMQLIKTIYFHPKTSSRDNTITSLDNYKRLSKICRRFKRKQACSKDTTHNCNKVTAIDDLHFATDVKPKGCPKDIKGKRLPSKFEMVNHPSDKTVESTEVDQETEIMDPTMDDHIILWPRKRDLEDHYLEKAMTKRLKQAHPPPLQFFVHSDIPRQPIIGTVDVKPDGWGRFRTIAHAIYGDESKFWKVKEDMLACYNRNLAKYKQYFTSMYNLTKSETQFPMDLIASVTIRLVQWNIGSPLQVGHSWAADTFRTPVAVYPDNSGPVPPLLYLPFEGPVQRNQLPLPIIMQLVNGCH